MALSTGAGCALNPFLFSDEAVSKCSILFKIKEGENFNHRNTLSISRIKI
jgi:hypothetical protein